MINAGLIIVSHASWTLISADISHHGFQSRVIFLYLLIGTQLYWDGWEVGSQHAARIAPLICRYSDADRSASQDGNYLGLSNCGCGVSPRLS